MATAGTNFPATVILAASWNKDLAYRFGEMMGKQADELETSGWYAPAMNIHRSAFAGRNFEYYSEDPVLSGYVAANTVAGAMEHGVYSYIKHFVVNDQEVNRLGQLFTWCSEQSLREIYLRPFEIAVKQGKANAVMSSMNNLGDVATSNCPELLNTVLRDEWGFRGMVVTDMFTTAGYLDADREIRAGNDLMLKNTDVVLNFVTDTESATSIKAMRTATHNILYTVANSRACAAGNGAKMLGWVKIAIVIDVLIAAALIVLEVLTLRNYKRRRNDDSIVVTRDKQ